VWSPDGSKVASGSLDKSVRIWDTSNGRNLRVLKGHTHYVIGVDWSPDGKVLASGSDDHFIKLWDMSLRDRDQK
jgi:WD40 repeat protein